MPMGKSALKPKDCCRAQLRTGRRGHQQVFVTIRLRRSRFKVAMYRQSWRGLRATASCTCISHGIIAKTPRMRRWRVINQGCKAMGVATRMREHQCVK